VSDRSLLCAARCRSVCRSQGSGVPGLSRCDFVSLMMVAWLPAWLAGWLCSGWWVGPDEPACTMVAVLIDTEVLGGKSAEELVAAKGGRMYSNNVPAKL
jgi:hypothetical protein